VERASAEVVWFVRGNTLYRRFRLIDDETREQNTDELAKVETFAALRETYPAPDEAGQYVIVESDETSDGKPQRYDTVPNSNNGWRWVTLLSSEDLSLRARRFGHDGIGRDGIGTNAFPYPIYDAPYKAWRYLRMPTIDESDYWNSIDKQYWKDYSIQSIPRLSEPEEAASPDLWNQPYYFPESQDRKSGSLKAVVEAAEKAAMDDEEPYVPRTGEDVVLTNVLSFDVKVWDPITKQFVDLGTEGTVWDHKNNTQTKLLGVWDSWTLQYDKESIPHPPYTESLEAIRIMLRCFDPTSRTIRQVTVVHRFR
jgi:hypothetical protein